MHNRQDVINNLRSQPEVDVLIIGGGVNGIGTYRELALQGLRVLLVDKYDYCSGASAGSSHMLHGGIRYLENAEFRLVREALHERNRMLRNAPHYAKPLPTTIPIFRWFSGLFNAPMKFLGLMNRPAERGAVVIKLGLMMYDWFTRKNRATPTHELLMKDAALKKYPRMNPNIKCVATYYDAWMPSPERLCIDLLSDSAAANEQAFALNYMPVTGGGGDTATITDSLSGDSLEIKPRVVINAGGPWIDFVNKAMDHQTRFIGGTKGSHLILDHPELYEAANGSEIFFENDDGRIVLIFPYINRVMVGTTDIRIEDPEEAVCTEDEVDYILELVKKVFPDIKVDRSHIVFRFSGVRPLPSSEDSRTGTISRDHSIKTVGPDDNINFKVHSLIGGKWTSMRAFSEQAADRVMGELGITRKIRTETLPIGGGKDFPTTDDGRDRWLNALEAEVSLSIEQLATLLDRYGTRAVEIARYMTEGDDAPLKALPDYTRREIAYLALNEMVTHLDDFLMRRSLLAMLGYVTLTPGLLEECAGVGGEALGWDSGRVNEEIERVTALLRDRHGVEIAVTTV